MLKNLFLSVAISLAAILNVQAQTIPSPKAHFGFDVGDDYMLATFTQTEAYFKILATSDRVKLINIGTTEEGRTQPMLIVTSPENHKKLARYLKVVT